MDSKFDGFSETCQNFLKYIDKTENYKKSLMDKQSDCDKRLIDIDHAFELVPMNAVKLQKVVAMRKEVLKQRRIIKDDIEIVNMILSKFANIQDIHNRLKGLSRDVLEIQSRLEARQYTPRVLDELFPQPEVKNKDMS